MSYLDDMLDLWRKQSTVNREVLDEIKHLHAELAEICDGMVALSNRIESVTRAALSTDFPGLPRGRGDTITVVPEPLGDGTPCPRCGIYVHRPAHSCHVSRSNYVVA